MYREPHKMVLMLQVLELQLPMSQIELCVCLRIRLYRQGINPGVPLTLMSSVSIVTSGTQKCPQKLLNR